VPWVAATLPLLYTETSDVCIHGGWHSEVIFGGPTDIFPKLDYETESAFFRHYFGTFPAFFEFKK
jgi:hypothetical protein